MSVEKYLERMVVVAVLFGIVLGACAIGFGIFIGWILL